MMTRRILHLDLDAFFCAIEEQRDPTLIGLPFAVGGRPEQRGVVTSCSYPARRMGVRSAMPIARACRLYPELRIVTPNHRLYSDISKQVMEILHNKAALMEQISIDEAFLEISDLPESSEKIALELQSSIQRELGLPCSIGVASNKLVAKIATDYGKAAARGDKPPNAITIVPPGQEADFLDPLPVNALWGVGPKTAARFRQHAILTIGDLSRYPVQELTRIFGKNGYELSMRSRGIDDRPLNTYHEPKSVSQETTFTKDIGNREQLLETMKILSSRVAKYLQKVNKRGVIVKIKIRWPDFTTLTRQLTLAEPTNQEEQIYTSAIKLLDGVWIPGQAVRLIGVGVSGFDRMALQLGLWDKKPISKESPPQLKAAVESLRKRYGDKVVVRGSEIGQEISRKKPGS